MNIDFLDFNDTIITSDIFSGVVNGLAQSQLVASGLTVGAEYKILFTGTAVQGGRYQIDLAAGVTPPAIPKTPVVPTSNAVSLFDTLAGDKSYGAFASGDALLIDGILGESGGIQNDALFDFSGGTLSAGIVWLVAPGNQRTVGVNVDLLDSTDSVVASDIFLGVVNGQAFSNFVVNGLGAGSYRLAFTGTATQGGRYRIDLGTNATAPGMTPILPAVPEPESWALLLLGFALTGWVIRRGHRQPSLTNPAEKQPHPAQSGSAHKEDALSLARM